MPLAVPGLQPLARVLKAWFRRNLARNHGRCNLRITSDFFRWAIAFW